MALILFFILILNVVAIVLTYYCLTNVEKKEKFIFIAVGVAIMYILTSIVYWISTKGIAIKEVSEIGKKLITFMFVPINSIITLPIIAKSYSKYKMGNLALDKIRNRVIAIAILLLIVLGIEHSYFKDIQNDVIKLIENNKQVNEIIENDIDNNIIENTINGVD